MVVTVSWSIKAQRQKQAHQNMNMLIVFFIIHCEHVSCGQTIIVQFGSNAAFERDSGKEE